MSNSSPLRLGILGAASIARRNWPAMYHSRNVIVAAVASRDRARAQQMIEECQATHPFPHPPKAVDNYEAVLADPGVDAVYIPLPTAVRREWVMRAAEAGKHVICEKPCAVNSASLCEMIEACHRNKVQFMDGVMFMHNPRLERLRTLVDDTDRFGPIRRITSEFSFLGAGNFYDANVRVQSALEPNGCLGDLGWYCIRFSLWVMGWQMPRTVTGRVLASATESSGHRVPVDFSGELVFEGGTSAGFHCSFLIADQQWANISGAQSSLRLSDFVLPRSDRHFAWEIGHQPVPKSETGIELGTLTAENSQETLLFRNFANQVLSGTLNEDWPNTALQTQQVMDTCLTSAHEGGRVVDVN